MVRKACTQLDFPSSLLFSDCEVYQQAKALASQGVGLALSRVTSLSKVLTPEAQSPLRSTTEHVDHQATGQQFSPMQSMVRWRAARPNTGKDELRQRTGDSMGRPAALSMMTGMLHRAAQRGSELRCGNLVCL